jgi:hypothetical protein
MYRKLSILILIFLFPVIAFSQIKFGPSVNLGISFFDKTTTKNYDIKGGICPSFGVTMQNEINYWLSLKSSLLYSFSQIKTTTTPGGADDQLKGQFIDLIVAGRFSGFDDASKFLPYGVAGLGNSFNIVNKGAESYLANFSYKGYVPYFTVGLGTGIKMTFFSEIDISFNYNRYLAPVIELPDGSGSRMNMVVFKLSGLF